MHICLTLVISRFIHLLRISSVCIRINILSTIVCNSFSYRVFKKTAPNAKLTLYLSSRDLVVSAGQIDRLQGVLLVDPEFVENRRVYGQVTLTFRYGREDEEVMGLKFCNEAIMCLAQLYPPHPNSEPPEGNTPLQVIFYNLKFRNSYDES
ncbi:hypothetical protein HHI36_012298 [Cryptolaemus montrouzieri]|uniref:Arrestin-like N-terminal domain-containing protein n=1 Tax=Cryptolaemus montrouzieri TaxID=559131 RepID=A0ABD2NEK6_9CUCU